MWLVVKMSNRLKKHIPVLKVLHKAKDKERKRIINSGNKELVLCLCECIVNILNGNVPTTSEQKKKLRRYAKNLNALKSQRTSLKKKKQLFGQKGGFLPLLLAPIIGVVGGLIGDLVSSAIKK